MIQMTTMIDWPMMYCGVPKKRAMRSAKRPKGSSPNAPPRRRVGRDGYGAVLDDCEALDRQTLAANHVVLAQLLAGRPHPAVLELLVVAVLERRPHLRQLRPQPRPEDRQIRLELDPADRPLV